MLSCPTTAEAESKSPAGYHSTTLSWLRGMACGTAILALSLSGCTREHYRNQADDEVAQLLDEKNIDQRWAAPDVPPYGDPRSRYYDPYNPDQPPMPPDDPYSHEIMKCVYGMKGYRHWEENGTINHIENQSWRFHLEEMMEKDADGNYVLNLESAVQLAVLHSPDYRSNIEELYLSALDVSTERFAFDTQFFLGNSTSFVHSGSENPGPNSRSILTTTTNRGREGRGSIAKLLPTGGQLLVDFANTFVWSFSGANGNSSVSSLLGFSLVQPLLRNAGRDVILNNLTIVERALLSNLRQMERYRRGFYSNVSIGLDSGRGPSRRGGFFGGTGLTGFTGQGVGGFGGVGGATGFGGGGFFRGAGGAGGQGGGGFAGGAAGNVGGFYGLLQRAQQIRNQRANLNSQFENLARVEALFEAGRIDSQQVDQFRQAVQTARSGYLSAINGFRGSLDNYLTNTLGLPPDLPIVIDEGLIEPFQFADPSLTTLQEAIDSLLRTIRAAEMPDADDLGSWLQQYANSVQSTAQHLQTVRDDFVKLTNVYDRRLEQLSTEEEKQEFVDQVVRLREDFGRVEQLLLKKIDSVGEVQKIDLTQAQESRERIVDETESLSEMLLSLQLIQAGTRLEAIVIEPIKLAEEQAFAIAMANRFDLMNLRASMVDQWRLIGINANRLESNVDVEFSGQIGTRDRNPIAFRDDKGSLTARLRIDAPLTRVIERNNYRQSLIDYQRLRRDYIGSIDTLKQGLRGTIRTIEQFQEEMEFQRKAMRIAIRRVDQTQESLKEPPRPEVQAAALGDTAVRNLLDALADLLNTQNQVLATYLTYQAQRLQLYRDLEVVKFDANGIWIDEPLDAALEGVSTAEPYHPPACPPLDSDIIHGDSIEMIDESNYEPIQQVKHRQEEPGETVVALNGITSLDGTDPKGAAAPAKTGGIGGMLQAVGSKLRKASAELLGKKPAP